MARGDRVADHDCALALLKVLDDALAGLILMKRQHRADIRSQALEPSRLIAAVVAGECAAGGLARYYHGATPRLKLGTDGTGEDRPGHRLRSRNLERGPVLKDANAQSPPPQRPSGHSDVVSSYSVEFREITPHSLLLAVLGRE
jgi:hypothetical protein